MEDYKNEDDVSRELRHEDRLRYLDESDIERARRRAGASRCDCSLHSADVEEPSTCCPEWLKAIGWISLLLVLFAAGMAVLR